MSLESRVLLWLFDHWQSQVAVSGKKRNSPLDLLVESNDMILQEWGYTVSPSSCLLVCLGMHSGNSREALVICRNAIVFSLAGKYYIYLFCYSKIKLTFLFLACFTNQDDTDLICKPTACIVCQRTQVSSSGKANLFLILLITKTRQYLTPISFPFLWNITWQHLLPFIVAEIINTRIFMKKWVKEEESDQYWKNSCLQKNSIVAEAQGKWDQLQLERCGYLEKEHQKNVGVKGEDGWKEKKLKKILEVRRLRT